MSAWGCPHQLHDKCLKVQSIPCDPGMKGCVLAGRYYFVGHEEKNKRLMEKKEALDKKRLLSGNS